MKKKFEDVLVAIDFEASGPILGLHSVLSFGAAIVPRERLTFKEFEIRDLVFYREFSVDSLEFERKAFAVGASHLECLEHLRVRKGSHEKLLYGPKSALQCMQGALRCFLAKDVLYQFDCWLTGRTSATSVIGLTDTVFFDSPQMKYLYAHYAKKDCPFGYRGLDLRSLYCGYTRRFDAKLSEIKVPKNTKPHKANHDAVELAQRTHILIHEKMKW